MAGDGEDGCMYVLLLFITVFMRLPFIRRRSRFQQRLRLLTIRSNKRRTEACYFQLRRKFRKKKIAWVLKRPQFWFEHVVLSHYENNIWREHFRISRQSFRFVSDLVRPRLARQDTNMRRAIPVEKRVAKLLSLVSNNLDSPTLGCHANLSVSDKSNVQARNRGRFSCWCTSDQTGDLIGEQKKKENYLWLADTT